MGIACERKEDGSFEKSEARCVLKEFRDKQKEEQRKDSPAASRPGCRMTCQLGANLGTPFYHSGL